MNTRFPILLIVLSTMLLSLLPDNVATSDESKEKEECEESLIGLATCVPYVGGTANAPTSDCCGGLKQLMKTNEKCLCLMIQDRNDPEFQLINVNVTLALSLPRVCSVPANISQCPALLKLPPNSTDAQIFYQLGENSTTSISSTPIVGQPNANVNGNPTSVSAGYNSGSDEQESGAYAYEKGFLGLEICVGSLVLFWSFTAYWIV